MSAMRKPAAMLTISWVASAPVKGATASRICCGLTASTITSQFRAAASTAGAHRTPKLSVSRSRASAFGSTTWMPAAEKPFFLRPPIRATAMLPPPMNVIFMI